MNKWIFCILISWSIVSFAQIYMKVDKNGGVSYSDMPSADAKAINLPNPQAAPPPPVVQEAKTTQESAIPARVKYQSFRITSPVDQETIQNQPSLVLSVKTEPLLQEGDKIQIYVDAKRMGPPQATYEFDVGRIDRGTHEVYAQIVDKDNRHVLQSNVITIYYRQASANTRPNT